MGRGRARHRRGLRRGAVAVAAGEREQRRERLESLRRGPQGRRPALLLPPLLPPSRGITSLFF